MTAPAVRRPLVSIVTPSFNRGGLIAHTLRSVRNQTYDNLEHIVVDGGSTDGTSDILREYETTYRMRWQSEADGGMYEAINKGLRSANGEILAYLNSDDLYLPWAVEAVVQQFVRHPQADFVFGCAISIDDETGRQILRFQVPFNVDFIRRAGFICQPSVFWRRSVVDAEGGFDESLRYVADCDYWMRVGKRRKFVKLNEFVAIERNHGAALRFEQSDAVSRELASVRSRYVRMNGIRHRSALIRHSVRNALWVRVYWAWYLIQSLLPGRFRRQSWKHLIDAGQTSIRWSAVPLRLFPRARKSTPTLVRPSRHWLEPIDEGRLDRGGGGGVGDMGDSGQRGSFP